MKQLIILLIATFLLFSHYTYSQNTDSKPTYISQATKHRIVSSLTSKSSLTLADTSIKEALDGRSSRGSVIPGKGTIGDDILAKNQHRLTQQIQGRTPSLVFDASFSGVEPTDPSLAVGPNHVFVVFNKGFRIFDKDGIALTAQLAVENIFSEGGCCDLTVSYDNAADRWVVGYQFPNNSIQVAVSQTANPVTTAWNVYTIPGVDDYTKLSVWSDGYYISGNINGGPDGDPAVGESVFALERDAMLAGDPNPGIIGFPLPGITVGTGASGFYAPQFLNVSNNDLPAAGGATVVYQQGDEYAGVTFDHINLWTINVDFDTPTNSTISAPVDLTLTDFNPVFDGGNIANLEQPNGGSSIDALQSLIANQAQFRRFPTHNSAVFSFVVDVLGGDAEQAGVRWVELRQNGDNQPWSVFQEGTYTSPNGKHAWNASIIMDSQGNIGMGYTAMGGTTNTTLSSYYTGRFANDPAGTMTISETLIQQGTGNIPGSRYGDYSKIDVDPVNDREFWFINEIINNTRADVVGVFQVAAVLNNDIGVVNINLPRDGFFTDNENITVDIFNFGNTLASNFDITYQVNNGALITERFTGTLAPMTSLEYTFTQTANLSAPGTALSIVSCTALTGDEDNSNNCETIIVTNAEENDIGVTAITTPTSGTLDSNEAITITIENFGLDTQSGFDVSYAIDGGTPVVETVVATVNSGNTISYTFAQTVDLSIINQAYEIVASTLLSGDDDISNDMTTSNVINTIDVCQPMSDCATSNDGVTQIQLVNQDLITNCGIDIEGYSDDRDIVFTFEPDNNTFNGVLQMGFEDSDYTIWIDFNDNGVFENSEIVSQDNVTNGNTDFAFTIDVSAFDINTRLGAHIMRVRGEDTNFDGESQNPCENLQFGRTNDYTAFFDSTLTKENPHNADLSIIEIENNIFDISLKTTLDGESSINVYNLLGQQVLFDTPERQENKLNYRLDMSYVSSGIYIIQFKESGGANISRKILVR